MHGSRFRPRPLAPRDRLGGLLLRIDTPDCGCKPPLACLAGTIGGPDECPENRSCDCPLAACGCPPGEDHGLSCGEWAELLRAFDWRGFAEPPAPPPGVGVRKSARLALYSNRARRGQALFSAGDLTDAGPVGVQAGKGRVELGLCEGQRRSNGERGMGNGE